MFLKESASLFKLEACGRVKIKSVQDAENGRVAAGPGMKKADSGSACRAGAISYEASIAEMDY